MGVVGLQQRAGGAGAVIACSGIPCVVELQQLMACLLAEIVQQNVLMQFDQM